MFGVGGAFRGRLNVVEVWLTHGKRVKLKTGAGQS